MNSALGLHWHGLSGLLAAEALFVTRLQNAGTAEQRADGVRRLGALVEPVVGAGGVQVDRRISLTGNVLADDFDEAAVARALGVGDDNAIRGSLFPAGAAETNANHLTFSIRVSGAAPGSSRLDDLSSAPG